jgi:type I restriction enzyme R subunit
MKSQGLSGKPEDVANLKGDDARAAFIEHFKKVQKLQTQLDQYTDLTDEQEKTITRILPKDELLAFRGVYLETAQRLREQREKPGDKSSAQVDQLDFEFVLFASAIIDYDYIMKLIADFSHQPPGKQTMTREQLIGLIAGDSKFIDERDAITEYVRSLKAGEGLDENAIRAGYQQFKDQKNAVEVAEKARKHGLPAEALQAFIDGILGRSIFDGEQLTTLLAPLDLGWRARTEKELALMADLVPLLKKRAAGRDISGLKAYEE